MRILFHFSIFIMFGFLLREEPKQSAVSSQQSTVVSRQSAVSSQQSAVVSQQSAVDSMGVASRQSTSNAQ